MRPNGAFRLTGIDSIDWSDEVPMDLVGAMNEGGPPLGKGVGVYTCAAQLSVYLDECAAFELALLALSPLAGSNLSAVVFQLPIIVREEMRTHSALLANCSIKGRSVTVGNDGSALVKQYTLQPTYIVENGLSLVSLTPSL